MKIFKAFKNNENYYIGFNFDNGMVNLIPKEELPKYGVTTVNDTLIEKDVQNAWGKFDKKNFLEVDGSLVLFLFVKDLEGVFHRLRLALRKDGTLDKASVVLGVNEKLIKNEFGKGLF